MNVTSPIGILLSSPDEKILGATCYSETVPKKLLNNITKFSEL